MTARGILPGQLQKNQIKKEEELESSPKFLI